MSLISIIAPPGGSIVCNPPEWENVVLIDAFKTHVFRHVTNKGFDDFGLIWTHDEQLAADVLPDFDMSKEILRVCIAARDEADVYYIKKEKLITRNGDDGQLECDTMRFYDGLVAKGTKRLRKWAAYKQARKHFNMLVAEHLTAV